MASERPARGSGGSGCRPLGDAAARSRDRGSPPDLSERSEFGRRPGAAPQQGYPQDGDPGPAMRPARPSAQVVLHGRENLRNRRRIQRIDHRQSVHRAQPGQLPLGELARGVDAAFAQLGGG